MFLDNKICLNYQGCFVVNILIWRPMKLTFYLFSISFVVIIIVVLINTLNFLSHKCYDHFTCTLNKQWKLPLSRHGGKFCCFITVLIRVLVSFSLLGQISYKIYVPVRAFSVSKIKLSGWLPPGNPRWITSGPEAVKVNTVNVII